MRSKSIRYYYFTSITTVLIAGILIMGLIQSLLAVSYFQQEKEQPLQRLVSSIAVATRNGQFVFGENTNAESLQTLRFMADISGAVIFVAGQDGTIRYSLGQGAPELGAQVPQAALDQLTSPSGLYTGSGQLGGLYTSNHYTYGVPLYGEGGQSLGYLFVSADASGMREYLSNTMSTFILSAAIVLLVSSILALGLSNRTVIPIRRMSRAAQRFAEGDYSARVPVEGDDELTRLSVTFNEMAASVEATDISRRSFMGNIAHELRTPMTSIQGFVDGMLDGTIPEGQRDKYLAIVSDEVGRLARLTKNMLDVSRLEAGEYTPTLVVFDAWKPVSTVVLGAEQRLEDKSLAVEGLEDIRPVWVRADEDFVHQILYNLVDNAIKFANNAGTLTLAVTPGRAEVTVCVRNTGAGITAEALPYVFDRFYKADKSRGESTRGAGLGLHISKVLVGLMGGRIWVESQEGNWTQFLFTLPAAADPRGKQQKQ